jgi:hypothetical protein
VIGGSTRADVARLVDESAVLRARLVGLVHAFQRRRRPTKVAKVGAAALALLGVGGAAMGVRALHRGRHRRALMSPLRRRVRWALAAGIASLLARRFARRALAP